MIKIFNTKIHNINIAAFVLGMAFLISAVLGFFRNRLLASYFGAGNELDIYYAAFRIPDIITMVMVIGAVSAAIIPIFSEYLIVSREKAWKYFSNLLNVFLIFLIIVCAIAFLLAPFLISLIVPGFSQEKINLTVQLARIMFLSPILLGISVIISSILRVFKKFLITAMAPIMYNIGIIFGIIFFTPIYGIKGLALGVVLGSFLHLLIQIPILLKTGFKPKKSLNFFDPGFIKTIKLTIPRSIGLIAGQINFIVITIIASRLSVGSLAIFNLAESISRPVINLVAVSFSAATFPVLSILFLKKETEKFDNVFYSVFYKIFYSTAFLSIFIFIFRNQIVSLIYETGKFTANDARLTSACLGMFCIGLFAQNLILLTTKAFYAKQNTKIPALISIFGMLINIAFSYLFIYFLSFSNFFHQIFTNFLNIQNLSNIEIIGLPLALSLSAIIQLFFLLFFLKKK